jgi:hypothetical protein
LSLSHCESFLSGYLPDSLGKYSISCNLLFDIELYGYGNNLPNLGGFFVYILPTVGFTIKRFGFDIGIVPVGILTGSFRIDIEGICSGFKK